MLRLIRASIAPALNLKHHQSPRINRSIRTMSDLTVELAAPNGRRYRQPTGLFIDNEWVKSASGEKITSINPTYDYVCSVACGGSELRSSK